MIAYLRGTLIDSSFSQVIIDVNGVGYEVNIPLSTFDKLPLEGGEAELFIHTAVREDAITLFGFATKQEKELFRILIGVSGIGGKLANAILSSMVLESFVGAIKSGQVSLLSKIPGVGKKTAERLIVELKDKLDNFDSSAIGVKADGGTLSKGDSQAIDDVIVALSQLGYKKDQATAAVQKIVSSIEGEIKAEELLRLALQNIGR
ncbi:MAG: Holliday junction branch migration protein RuvA [Lentisphaeria bacterium]|nr:Holliday junction branch migration protein RuvA [Lentisphaeria bacterium]MBR7128014.1 Holliday junction branch migration protein RuvA [Lentisphaeria bacterium]